MASPNVETLRSEIIAQFGDIESELIAECIKLCQMYNLSGESLFFKWEAMNYGSARAGFTADAATALKQHIQREMARAGTKKQQLRSSLSGPLSKNLGGLSFIGRRSEGLSTAEAARREGQHSRKLPGEDHQTSDTASSSLRFVCPEMENTSNKSRRYRYMYEKVTDRSDALDDRIDEIARAVKEHYGIAELGDPSATTEEEIAVVGRIVTDADSSSAGSMKLNEASLALESSRMMGSGVRVLLKFDPGVKVRQGTKGSGVGFFPGAVVALRGKNGGGGWFSVTEFLPLPQLPVRSNINAADGGAFEMYIACGPFTPDANMKFEPWRTLLAKMKSAGPSVTLLVGPFLDSTHPSFKNGDIDVPPSEIFKEMFASQLREYLDLKPRALVLVVPSVRDIISDHVVFPQCEFDTELFNDPRIRLLANPSRFALNGVTFAVSSVDILFHLRKEEFSKQIPVNDVRLSGDDEEQSIDDPMTNLCRHILQQRSFYPIFPVPSGMTHDVNLDVAHSDLLHFYGEEKYCPDILILPSKLKQFSKIVDQTLVINPSFVAKDTYAILKYKCQNAEYVKDCTDISIQKIS